MMLASGKLGAHHFLQPENAARRLQTPRGVQTPQLTKKKGKEKNGIRD